MNSFVGKCCAIATLVADVASSYFQLRQLDLELEISKRTLSSRQDSLGLTKLLEQHGINSMLDVRQSEQLVYTAAAEVPDLQRQIQQQENAISILLGNNPGDIPRGLKLTEQPHAPEVPAGIPSALLERRPDIGQAEANLIAANAQIGVARRVFSADLLDWNSRVSKRETHRSVPGTGRDLVVSWEPNAADLRRRTTEIWRAPR